MFMKALLMTPKLLLNPLSETLAKAKLMIPIFYGEAPSRNIVEHVVGEAEVNGKASTKC